MNLMSERKTYFPPKMTVTEIGIKDIVTLSIVDNLDGTYPYENSAFWEE